jgi:hypothetical protein
VGPAQGGAHGEQKPDVFGDIEAGNEDTFCTTGPPRRMPPRSATRKGARGGIDYGGSSPF